MKIYQGVCIDGPLQGKRIAIDQPIFRVTMTITAGENVSTAIGHYTFNGRIWEWEPPPAPTLRLT